MRDPLTLPPLTTPTFRVLVALADDDAILTHAAERAFRRAH